MPSMKRGARSTFSVSLRTAFRLCIAASALRALKVDAASAIVALNPVADTTIFDENADASDAKSPSLFAGRNNRDAIRRAFLRFDFTSAIPAGVVVSSAELRLSLTRSNSGFVFASLYRVSAAWGEGTSNAGTPGGSGAPATAGDVTWTRRIYPGTFWLTPGGDTAPAATATALIGSSLTNYVFTTTPGLVADVQHWVDHPETNFGWQLRADETQIAPTAKRFGARESTDPTLAPLLLVTYGANAGPSNGVPALDTRMQAVLALLLAVGGTRLLNRAP